jgi:hypothetical protein
MTAFELGEVRVAPAAVWNGVLGAVNLFPDVRVGVPAVVVNGAEAGPTLVATAAAHGQEIVGTGALIETVKRIEPEELRGTLVAITVANPLAVMNGSYATPYDGVNICGPLYWPPIEGGTPTQRLASFIAPALQHADYYIDLHGNATPAAPMTMMYLDQCADEATRTQTRRMADAFGFTPVDMIGDAEAHNTAILGTTSGYPTAIANAHGIPAIMVELVGNATTHDSNLGASGVVNVMRALGMLDGEPEALASGRLDGDFVYWGALMASAAGLLWVRRPPGDLLDAGEPILELTDPWGRTLQEIAMPTRGFAWGFLGGLYGAGTHAVPEGAMVGFVAKQQG